MLYVDQVAATESEAIDAASKIMRLDKKDVSVVSVEDVPDGVKVRVEAARSRGDEVLDLLDEILKSFRISTELFYLESFEKIVINIKGPHLGLIIGKAGSTLEALETLVSAMHNQDFSIYKPVVINPGGYRENKRKALKSLVRRAVEEAGNGEKVSLPCMRQRDRKQVHQIIKEFPGFQSRSFGEGNDRRVFIFVAGDDELTDEGDKELIPHDTQQGVDDDRSSRSI